MPSHSSTESNCKPGHTWPRKISRACAVGGLRQQNSVANTRPPGSHTRASSAAARGRSTNIVTASASTQSKLPSASGRFRMSGIRDDDPVNAGPADVPGGSLPHQRRDITSDHRGTALLANADGRRAHATADVQNPVPGCRCAHSSSWSVEASPAGMDHLLAQHGEERVWVKSLDFRSTQPAHYNPSVFKPLLE